MTTDQIHTLIPLQMGPAELPASTPDASRGAQDTREMHAAGHCDESATPECRGCELANENALSGLYHADCMDCWSRMLAHSPVYFEAGVLGQITPAYRAELERIHGRGWKAGHERVKEWAKRIKEAE